SGEIGWNARAAQELLIFRWGLVHVFHILAQHLTNLRRNIRIGQGWRAGELVDLSGMSVGGSDNSGRLSKVRTRGARNLSFTSSRKELTQGLTCLQAVDIVFPVPTVAQQHVLDAAISQQPFRRHVFKSQKQF